MRRCFLSSVLALVAVVATNAELTVPVAGPFNPLLNQGSAAQRGAQEEQKCCPDELYHDCPSHFDYTCEFRKEYDEAMKATRRATGTCGMPGCRCKPGYLRRTDYVSECVKKEDCPVPAPIKFPNGTEVSPNDLSKY